MDSMVCLPCVPQWKDTASKESSQSLHTLPSQTSKISSLSVPSERPPMVDISNKLHALVDEFVSNLSSECSSLAHTVSAQAQIYLANDIATDVAKQQRPSNHTVAEVLSGLIRPSAAGAMDSQPRVEQSQTHNAKVIMKEGKSRNRDDGRRSQTVELLSSDHSSDDCPRPAPKP